MDIVSTKSVSSLLGVSEATVKRWADAGVLRCFRTRGGHRKFRLRDVRAFLDDRPLTDDSQTLAPPPTPVLSALEGDAKRAHALAMAGDVDGLVAIVTRAREAGHSYAETFDRVIAPALHEIGQRWACGEASIAQEHVATNAVLEMLARLRPFAEASFQRFTKEAGSRRGAEQRRALCACLGEEQHDLGLRMVALVLAERGYKTQIVGARIPAIDLARVVGSERPGLVALSAAASADPEQLRGDLAVLASAATTARSRIIVGGDGFANLARHQRMPGVVALHEAIAGLASAAE